MRDVITQTARLELVKTEVEDFEHLYEKIFSVEEVVQYTFGKGFGYNDSLAFMKKNFNFRGNLGFSPIIEKRNKKLIGYGGIMNFRDGYEFGYILAKDAWGKGYATEIAIAQIEYIKKKLNSSNVYATVHPENYASVRVLEKVGLHKIEEVELKRGTRRVYRL
ncbi:MAG TPA: N-acetyltransferase [Nitratifractor sp.]|nr:N-acetyltransferase [Nitratifractor sp.]